MPDSKVTALTALMSVVSADILYIVDDPAGTPTSKKATVGDVLSASATGNLTAGTGVIWASGTAGKYTGVVTTGNLQAGTSVIWPSGTATTYTGLTTAGNVTAGTSVIWPSGTAAAWTGLTTTGNVSAGTGVIWASGTAGQWTGVVTTGNVQAGTALVWPSGTATTWTGLNTTGNLTAGTSVIWASGTAGKWTGLNTTGNVTAGTSVIWASGTAAKWTGLDTSGNVTAGTSIIWPNGTATTTGLTVRGATSLGGPANYTKIDGGGHLTMAGTATVFDDLRVSASMGRLPTSDPPDLATWKGGIQLLAFDASTDQQIFFEVQLPHAWKIGSDVMPHVHWMPAVTGTGVPRWGLEYAWTDSNAVFPAAGTTYGSAISTPPAGGTAVADTHYMTSLGTITGTAITGLSSMMACRLFRDADSANDTYGSDAWLLEFDVHYESDTLGSNQETVK